jgi:hypothetical protein
VDTSIATTAIFQTQDDVRAADGQFESVGIPVGLEL